MIDNEKNNRVDAGGMDTVDRTKGSSSMQMIPEKQRERGLILDTELQALIPPLSLEEFDQLQENIIRDGCREPLTTWHNVIIDGHHRFHICQKLDIPFETREMEFEDREAVKEWMIKNQLGRRNIPISIRVQLASMLHEKVSEEAKKRKLSNLKSKNGSPEGMNSSLRGKTRETLAKAAKVSPQTYDRGKKILEHGPDWLQDFYKRELLTTNAAWNILQSLARGGKDVQDCVSKWVKHYGDDVHITSDKIDVLIRLHRNGTLGTNTFGEVRDSGFIQTEEKTVEFFKTSVRDIEQVMKIKSRIHRQMAMDAKDARLAVPPDKVGEYRVLYADYPKLLDRDDLERMDVGKYAMENAVLFLWTPVPQMGEMMKVMEHWGFTYWTHFVWRKTGTPQRGFQHEVLLMGTRGSCVPEDARIHDSIITADVPPDGSKPPEFLKKIDQLFSKGKKGLLFQDGDFEGWDVLKKIDKTVSV